jgi:queuine tRNA-ribosyltransferase
LTGFFLGNTPIHTPVFLPDATYGNVKALDARDLENCGIKAVIMNAFHLMQQPGSSTIKSLGGLHKMSNWKGVIFTDSGGFQAYSLLKNNPGKGSITDKGLIIKNQNRKGRVLISPEKTIQHQLSYGADVIYCLDECTHPDAPLDYQEKSVERTIQWARRSKQEYLRLINYKENASRTKPKIFAVIQGGRSHELRQRCAYSLLEIGFDGFGYGGWPVDNTGSLLIDIAGFIRELVPKEYPLHMLGVGHPKNIQKGVDLGWQIFDSSLPTRDARRGRLFSFSGEIYESYEGFDLSRFDYLYIGDKKHIKKNSSIYRGCNCYTCKNYSTAFLHHLFKVNDHLYYRLATIHNLTYITNLCVQLSITPDEQ